MKRLALVVIFSIICLLAFGIFFLYYFFGLKHQLRVINAIKELPPNEQILARENIYGTDELLYRGLFAGVTKWPSSKIWIWGLYELRSFTSDEYTVYSYYRACDESTLEAMIKGKNFSIDRSIDTDLEVWRGKVRVGDYAILQVATEINGGILGNLREIIAHDWWGYIPLEAEVQCEK